MYVSRQPRVAACGLSPRLYRLVAVGDENVHVFAEDLYFNANILLFVKNLRASKPPSRRRRCLNAAEKAYANPLEASSLPKRRPTRVCRDAIAAIDSRPNRRGQAVANTVGIR